MSAALKQRFGRSLKLRSVSAGGCNACELEVNALTNVNFDIGRYGIDIVASPRHADGLVLTGPISRNMAPALQLCWDGMPEPKLVIAVGACAISGSPFEDGDALDRRFLERFKPYAVRARLPGPSADLHQRHPRPAGHRELSKSAHMCRGPPMSETINPAHHVKPFVYESLTTKALHFSISEIQSRMDLRDPYALDLEYTQTMMGFLLFLPQPQRIAMIGLGGGSLAKFCHRYLPRTYVQVVEINPHVIALREHFHVPPDDERFQVIHGDGVHFVRYRATRPDVLMVDGFDSNGLPARLSSQRFYDDCHEMLQPGGVHGREPALRPPPVPRHLDRIQCSFGGAVLVVDDSELSNSIVFACKGTALDAARAGVVRRPKGLDRAACEQLLGAFARVNRALRDRDEA